MRNGGPAFPQVYGSFDGDEGELTIRADGEGLSVRDYFAARTLQALLAREGMYTPMTAAEQRAVLHRLATRAYLAADMMLLARAGEDIPDTPASEVWQTGS